MFIINGDQSIFLTRGDIAVLEIGAKAANGEPYEFQVGDIVCLKVTNRKRCDQVVIQKSVTVTEASATVGIYLDSDDTRFGEVIHKPTDYWYEVELNPDTAPQTIIGYDSEGPKIFRLFPEGADRA